MVWKCYIWQNVNRLQKKKSEIVLNEKSGK